MSNEQNACYGGAWNYEPSSLLLIYHGRILTSGWDSDLGFRVCIDPKIIYGGSWRVKSQYLRSGYQRAVYPEHNRNYNIAGFRVIDNDST